LLREATLCKVGLEIEHKDIIEGHVMTIATKYYKGIFENEASVSITSHGPLSLKADSITLYDLVLPLRDSMHGTTILHLS
jgi:hypothetical protein